MDVAHKNVPKMRTQNEKFSLNMRRLRLSLKYRPEILKLILRMRQTIRKKNILVKNLRDQLKSTKQPKDLSVQTATEKYNEIQLDEKITIHSAEKNATIAVQINCATQTDLSTEHNLINTANMKVNNIDKSTSCAVIVKDSFSQTKNVKYMCIEINKEDAINSKLVNTEQNTAIENLSAVSVTEEQSTKEDLIVRGVDGIKLSTRVPEDYNISETNTQSETALQVKETKLTEITLKNSSTQTENIVTNSKKEPNSEEKLTKTEDIHLGWTNTANGEEKKSIAEQVKEVAQSAMQQSGMVYVESAGMYYDYKTGYYYNSELGLYYHTDTGCYYYYSDDQKTFVFHSYPDRSADTYKGIAKPIKRTKTNKKKNKSDELENLTKNLSQDEKCAESTKRKRKRSTKHKKNKKIKENDSSKESDSNEQNSKDDDKETKKEDQIENKEVSEKILELEDGECSDSGDEKSEVQLSKDSSSSDESDASTATASDDESVAKHHPPCMRVIVRETNLPKLKVGSLFLVTKDGGTIGREGDHHAILLKDYNVSRNHLDIKFNTDKKIYTAVDLGSKNGTILNGVRMSESQEVSLPMEVVHGSTLQLGETKLLCHIHAGNDTCGHCEPGLIIEAEESEKKVAYTRICSVQKQYQLELARLKNKYAPEPLAIEEKEYNDRARARREAVGSSHHAEKTQSSDLDTFIPADNKGFKLLEKMGWSKGEGLGKESQGDTEPIPLVSNEGKSGLGAAPAPAPLATNRLGPATLRLVARSKMLHPPAKAFQQPMVDDSDSE